MTLEAKSLSPKAPGARRRAGKRTQAILLRSVDYGESDCVVTLYARDMGKVSALAKRARSSSRSLLIEPFCLLDVELGETRGELMRLIDCDARTIFSKVRSDLARMDAGGAALENVRNGLGAHDADERVFSALETFFAELDSVDADRVPALFYAFAIRFLFLRGWALRLDECLHCGKKPHPGQALLVDPRMGGAVCRDCNGGTARSNVILLPGVTAARIRASFSGGWALVSAQGALEPRELAVLNQLLSMVHVGDRQAVRVPRYISISAVVPTKESQDDDAKSSD